MRRQSRQESVFFFLLLPYDFHEDLLRHAYRYLSTSISPFVLCLLEVMYDVNLPRGSFVCGLCS